MHHAHQDPLLPYPAVQPGHGRALPATFPQPPASHRCGPLIMLHGVLPCLLQPHSLIIDVQSCPVPTTTMGPRIHLSLNDSSVIGIPCGKVCQVGSQAVGLQAVTQHRKFSSEDDIQTVASVVLSACTLWSPTRLLQCIASDGEVDTVPAWTAA